MSFVKAFDESMKDKYELVLVSVSWGACGHMPCPLVMQQQPWPAGAAAC